MNPKRVEVNGTVYYRRLTVGQRREYAKQFVAILEEVRQAADAEEEDAERTEALAQRTNRFVEQVARECVVAYEDENGERVDFDPETVIDEIDASDMELLLAHCAGSSEGMVRVLGQAPLPTSASPPPPTPVASP